MKVLIVSDTHGRDENLEQSGNEWKHRLICWYIVEM